MMASSWGVRVGCADLITKYLVFSRWFVNSQLPTPNGNPSNDWGEHRPTSWSAAPLPLLSQAPLGSWELEVGSDVIRIQRRPVHGRSSPDPSGPRSCGPC